LLELDGWAFENLKFQKEIFLGLIAWGIKQTIWISKALLLRQAFLHFY